MTTATYLLRGTMRTLEPVAISVPRGAGQEASRNLMVHTRPSYGDNNVKTLNAYIPGHTLKGAHRFCGVMAMADLLGGEPGDIVSAAGTMGVREFAVYSNGGLLAAGTSDTKQSLADARAFRNRNIMLALFGSMKLKMNGDWVFHDVDFGPVYGQNGVIMTQPTARRDVLRAHPEILNVATQEEVEAVLRGMGEQQEKSQLRTKDKKLGARIIESRKAMKEATDKGDDDAAASIQSELSEMLAEQDANKRDIGDKMESIGRKDEFKYYSEGLRAPANQELRNADPAMLGFALMTLQHLTQRCAIGGKVNSGHGQVSYEYDVLQRRMPRMGRGSSGAFEEVHLGTVKVAPYDFQVDVDPAILEPAMTALDEIRSDPSKRLDIKLLSPDLGAEKGSAKGKGKASNDDGDEEEAA